MTHGRSPLFAKAAPGHGAVSCLSLISPAVLSLSGTLRSRRKRRQHGETEDACPCFVSGRRLRYDSGAIRHAADAATRPRFV